MILQRQFKAFKTYSTDTFITQVQLAKILDTADEYKDDLLSVFQVDESTKVLKIGNAKHLIESINLLDSLCKKIDIKSKIKDIYLSKLLEEEKALFEIFSIKDSFIINKAKADSLLVETRYDAKSDILEYYNFSKFANYCRDNSYTDLLDVIKDYLKRKNSNNEQSKSLRIVYDNEEDKFYLRAFTSSEGYRNFGINFSIFVALMALGKYVEESQNEIYIDNYSVDDSTLYISFAFNNQIKINDNLSLSFSLVLENDEIKRSSVSFNGLMKLDYIENGKKNGLYLKPPGTIKDDSPNPVDLLSYPHRGSVQKVFEKILELPKSIDFFIAQVSEDAKRISLIKHPDDVKKFLAYKIQQSRKEEFKVYREAVFNKLMQVNVENTFALFHLLREVEDLFEHGDINSLNFWRNKLYETLVKGR